MSSSKNTKMAHRNIYKQFELALSRYPSSGTFYQKSKCFRPSFLNILRNFDSLGKEYDWTIFICAAYKNMVNQLLPAINKEINEYVHLDCVKPSEFTVSTTQDDKNITYLSYKLEAEMLYMKKFRNNILTFKKKCQDLSINYYNYLPGSQLPMDIRSHIVSFISPI